tara:strand:- start:654 stop:1250 length:597 start_codon:yes stop_codon:yes gene_type:complete
MNNAEILIIDDEPQIRKLLKITLESNDYKVVLAETGKEGVHLVANHTPDLVILDLGLPDKSGHLVLKDLREWYDKSIIILSVQDDEADIIKALDNGASDYLTKPFRTGELLARIRASLRISLNNDSQPNLITGDLEIDLSSRIVKRDGNIIKLTATEYNLIALLAKNQGRVLTHQFLLKEVWGLGYQNETQYLRVFVA